MRQLRISTRTHWIWAIPSLVAAGALLLASSDLLNPPVTPGTPSQLGMPGSRPADEIEKPQNTGFALEMRGTLISASREEVVIRLGPEEPEAVIFVKAETTFALEGRSVSFDELPEGGQVLAIFDLDGQKRIATSIDVNPPGRGAPQRHAVEPIVPVVPGARIEGGLPPDTAPEMPPAEKPRPLPRGEPR